MATTASYVCRPSSPTLCYSHPILSAVSEIVIAMAAGDIVYTRCYFLKCDRKVRVTAACFVTRRAYDGQKYHFLMLATILQLAGILVL